MVNDYRAANEARRLFIYDNYAYILYNSSKEDNIEIVDISNKGNIKKVNSFNYGLPCWDIIVKGRYAFIVKNNFELKITDISNPINPIEINTFYFVEENIFISQNFLFSFSRFYDIRHETVLEKLDISNIHDIKRIWEINFPENIVDIYSHENKLYLGEEGSDENNGVNYIYMNDDDPKMCRYYTTEYGVNCIRIIGNYMYLAGNFGIKVLDISDNYNPFEVASYGGRYNKIEISGKYIYAFASWVGLSIFRNDLIDDDGIPRQFLLKQSYPNPFNTGTTIEFFTQKHEQVFIKIYNILGQKIKEFANATSEIGPNYFTWDATDDYGNKVSSGIYIAQIKIGDYAQNMKLVYLK